VHAAKDAPQRLHRIVQFGAYDVFGGGGLDSIAMAYGSRCGRSW
jgi:hypothetical protein